MKNFGMLHSNIVGNPHELSPIEKSVKIAKQGSVGKINFLLDLAFGHLEPYIGQCVKYDSFTA